MVADRVHRDTRQQVTDQHSTVRPQIAQETDQSDPSEDSTPVLVSDFADLVDERVNPAKMSAAFFNYIEISGLDVDTLSVKSKPVRCDNAPGRARKLVRAGDILVSTVRPDRKAIAIVGASQHKFVCTTGFAVLRVTKSDPLVFAHLLRTDFVTEQMMQNRRGVAYPTIRESCLPGIVLPAHSRDLLRPSPEAEAVRVATETLRAHHIALDVTINEMVTSWNSTLDSF